MTIARVYGYLVRVTWPDGGYVDREVVAYTAADAVTQVEVEYREWAAVGGRPQPRVTRVLTHLMGEPITR